MLYGEGVQTEERRRCRCVDNDDKEVLVFDDDDDLGHFGTGRAIRTRSASRGTASV